MRLTIRRLLERTAGFVVAGVAESGSVSLEKVVASEPDVALIDYRIPHESGAGLTAKLRRWAPRLVVVGMSSDEGFRDVFLRAGASRFFCKRGGFSKLSSLLNEAAGASA